MLKSFSCLVKGKLRRGKCMVCYVVFCGGFLLMILIGILILV